MSVAEGADDPSRPTRERILAVARELYVLRGHDGLSFGEIAGIVGITRANIHHHFGTKRQLMEALVSGFAEDARERIRGHWVEGRRSLSERLAAQRADLERFYARFNPRPGSRNVWSPVARLRLDLATLGGPAERALGEVNACYDASLAHALAAAVEAGELRPGAPVAALAQVLRAVLLSAPPMTQDTGGFADVAALFEALDRTLLHPWRADAAA